MNEGGIVLMNYIEFNPPKVKASKLEKSLYLGCFILVVIQWGFFLYLVPSLPQEVPIHSSSLSGGDYSYGPKWTIIILPILATVMAVAMFGVRFAVRMMNFPVQVTEANAAVLIQLCRDFIAQMNLTIVALFFAIFIDFSLVATDQQIEGFWVVPVGILVWLFGVMIYYIIVMRKRGKEQMEK